MKPPSNVFRKEAIESLYRGTGASRDDVLRISPQATTWTYWLLVVLFAASVLYLVLARIDEHATGAGIIRDEGRTAVTAITARTRLKADGVSPRASRCDTSYTMIAVTPAEPTSIVPTMLLLVRPRTGGVGFGLRRELGWELDRIHGESSGKPQPVSVGSGSTRSRRARSRRTRSGEPS